MRHAHAGRSVRVSGMAFACAGAAVVLAAIAGEAWAAPAPRPVLQADRILVLKSARKLELLRDGHVIRIYPIALGRHPIGPKRAEGDGRTPEGDYIIDGRNLRSEYHLSLHISYPNPADRARAAAEHRDPGGDIFIHGLPDWYRGPKNPRRFPRDWTAGCISVGDRAIDQIAAAVPDGTPIDIRP